MMIEAYSWGIVNSLYRFCLTLMFERYSRGIKKLFNYNYFSSMTRDIDETLVKIFFFFHSQAFIKEVLNHSSLLLTFEGHIDNRLASHVFRLCL